jgi:hypothetical protein
VIQAHQRSWEGDYHSDAIEFQFIRHLLPLGSDFEKEQTPEKAVSPLILPPIALISIL